LSCRQRSPCWYWCAIELSNLLPTAPAQLGTFDATALAVLVGPLG